MKVTTELRNRGVDYYLDFHKTEDERGETWFCVMTAQTRDGSKFSFPFSTKREKNEDLTSILRRLFYIIFTQKQRLYADGFDLPITMFKMNYVNQVLLPQIQNEIKHTPSRIRAA
jgi:hypothetical protein